jgi:hypothetical protein
MSDDNTTPPAGEEEKKPSGDHINLKVKGQVRILKSSGYSLLIRVECALSEKGLLRFYGSLRIAFVEGFIATGLTLFFPRMPHDQYVTGATLAHPLLIHFVRICNVSHILLCGKCAIIVSSQSWQEY